MKMSGADQYLYPKTTKYVRYNLQKVINYPKIVNAMRQAGELNKTQFRNALKWGFGPTLKVTILPGAYGEFTPGTHEIRIARSLVNKYEGGTTKVIAAGGPVPLLGVTILHELAHWGDDQDGVQSGKEDGNAFENLVYGSVLG